MNDAQAADLLEELVRVPSPSRDESRAARLLVRRLSDLGFAAELDAVGNAVGRIGEHGPRIALLGHVDTVPGEVPVRRQGGALYGRGTVDAKGSLVTFVAAAARAAASGRLACRVELVACVEEEVPSSRGAHHRAALPAPDAAIIGEPSGWQGVTIGYKGFLRARLSRRGPLAHTAAEDPGLAARACRQFVALEVAAARFDCGRSALYERLLLHLAGLDVTDDGLHQTAALDLRLRLPPDLPPSAAIDWLAQHSPGWELESEGGLPAWSGPRSSPLVRLLGRAVSRCGGRPRHQRKTGTADLNVVAPAWGCPALAYGPGDSALDHAPDEHLELAELSRSIAVLEGFLTDPALVELAAAAAF